MRMGNVMQHELTLNDLAEFGLTNYEAKVYLALLEKKYLSVVEITGISHVPRTRVYDSLRSLELKGLCQMITNKPKLYIAVDPSRLVEVLSKLEYERTNTKIEEYEIKIKKEKNRLVEKLEDAKGLVDILSPIYEKSRHNSNDIDYIEIIKDPDIVQNKVCELISQAKTEALSFIKPPFTTTKKFSKDFADRSAKQIEATSSALKRGVSIRNIYEIPKQQEEIESLISILNPSDNWPSGGTPRVYEKLPLKLIIFDEETVIYSLQDPLTLKTTAIASVVKHPDLAMLLKDAFETYWIKAKNPKVLKSLINE